MAEPIETIKPTPVAFKGGKITTDNRQAKAGVLAQVRGQAVGMDAGDYEVMLVPAGTPVLEGQVIAKFASETPPIGQVNNVTVIVHVSNAGRPQIAEKV